MPTGGGNAEVSIAPRKAHTWLFMYVRRDVNSKIERDEELSEDDQKREEH